jgi:hypothetical protein
MAVEATRAPLLENKTLRQWISRAFLVSIVLYLAITVWLVAEAVTGASKWAPYGVNISLFIFLIVASEVIITATAVWIFKEDSGIWPASIAEGWRKVHEGSVLGGAKDIILGAWDVSLIDLRLRTSRAIFLGRLNRVAALVPLVYVLVASAGGAPWGMRSMALLDIALTLAVWAFIELVMVSPGSTAAETASSPTSATDVVAAEVAAASAAPSLLVAPPVARPARAMKVSSYEVRPVASSDVTRIEQIERIKWRDQAATPEMVLSRLQAFPQGQLAAVHVSTVDGLVQKRSLVAWCTVMPARRSQVETFARWDDLTGNGTIRGSDVDGEVIVGVNLTSVTEGATYLLVGEILASVVEWGKQTFVGGSRLNGFVAFNERRASEGKPPLGAEQYARLREVRGYRLNESRLDAGRELLSDDAYLREVAQLLDAQGKPPLGEDEVPDYVCANVRSYMSIPGMRLVRTVPDYFDDPPSANYGVLGEWRNPLPRPLQDVPLLRRWVAARIRTEVRQEWDRRKQRVRERAARRSAQQVPQFLRRDDEEAAEVTAIGQATVGADGADVTAS